MKLVFDTHPIISLLNNEENSGKISEIIEEIEAGKIQGFLSSITLSEVFYILARSRGVEFSESTVEHIESSNFFIVDVTPGIAKLAGKLKFQYGGKRAKKGMPLADCLIAATALENDATLLTDDEHFSKIKDLKTRMTHVP